MRNEPEYIVIHHSLTPDGDTKDWDAIRRYHIETNGWSDIGYHYGIEYVSGKLQYFKGRDWWKEGAHTKELGMNRRSIGICVVGNFDEEAPKPEVIWFLRDMIWAIQVNWSVPTDKVIGHRDVGLMAGYDWAKIGPTGIRQYKTCPGIKFPINGLRQMLVAEPEPWSGAHLLAGIA